MSILKAARKQSDLDHAVFSTPIDTLANLWLAKYGTDWIDKQTVVGDDFFEWAAMRLRSVGRLEEHRIWADQLDGNAQICPTSLAAITASRSTYPLTMKTVIRVVDTK